MKVRLSLPYELSYILSPCRTAPAATPEPPTETQPSSATPAESYHVGRTPSNQLPIYLLAKRGGNLQQTRIKKIQGDIAELRKQLRQSLMVDEKDIKINQLTGHIVIKV